MSQRTETLLQDLDKDEPPWLASPLTEAQANKVVQASENLWAVEMNPAVSGNGVARVVDTLLVALEEVVASNVDMAEALLASIQHGVSDEIVSVLEHVSQRVFSC